MEKKIKVIFYYIKSSENNYSFYQFLGNNYTFNQKSQEILISLDQFKGSNNCLPCEINLFRNENNDPLKFVINIYKCNNIFYLFLKENGNTYEFIFLDFDDIRIDNFKYSFDNNNNKHRKRITFINFCPSFININNNFTFTFAKFYSFFPYNSFSNFISIQFSIYSKDIIIPKINELPESIPDIKIFYTNYDNDMKTFDKELKGLLSEFQLEKYNSLISRYENIYQILNKFNFCISRDELGNIFDKIEYYDFFYKIVILKILIIKKATNKEEIESIIRNFNEFSQKLSKDNDLKLYQKIFALLEYGFFIKKYNYDQLTYVVCKNAKTNSVIDKSLKFFKEFINNLDEESPVFFKLLEINSKSGYLFGGSTVFNFNLLNVEDIKQHLQELIPEVIYFFNLDEKTTNSKAFLFSQTGEIAINEYYLFKKYEKINLLEEKKSDDINANNIAMTISRYLIHEEGGHNKFRNKANIKKSVKSPIKCVSEGKIKKLTNISDKSKSDDLIKIFPNNKNGKSDSGHFLETSFGKIEGEYVITYFDRIKDIGDLLSYPEYFVKADKIEFLGQYIYYKYLAELNNVKIKITSFYRKPLNYYIKIMKESIENAILRKKMNILSKKNEKEIINILSKKVNRNFKEESISNKVEENKSSSFINENLSEEENFSSDEYTDKEKKIINQENLPKLGIKLDNEEKYDSSDSEMLV